MARYMLGEWQALDKKEESLAFKYSRMSEGKSLCRVRD